MTDAIQAAVGIAAPLAKDARAIVTHQVNAIRQPIRNLIIAKPFGAVIVALIVGALVGGLLVHFA